MEFSEFILYFIMKTKEEWEEEKGRKEGTKRKKKKGNKAKYIGERQLKKITILWMSLFKTLIL